MPTTQGVHCVYELRTTLYAVYGTESRISETQASVNTP